MKDILNNNNSQLISKIKIAKITGKNYFKPNKNNLREEILSEKLGCITQYDEKSNYENSTPKITNNNDELSIRNKSFNYNDNQSTKTPKYKNISKKKNLQDKININYFSRNKNIKNLYFNKDTLPKRLNTISNTKRNGNDSNFNLYNVSDSEYSQSYRPKYNNNDNIINKDSGIDDILNLNNIIKIDDNNNILGNMIEIPEEEIHLNENKYLKSSHKTTKSSMSQKNLLLNSESRNKKFNTVKSRTVSQFHGKHLRRINSNILTMNKLSIKNKNVLLGNSQKNNIKKQPLKNNNYRINSTDNLFKSKNKNIYINKADFNSNNFDKKFESVIKESINTIQQKQKYEKSLKKLKEDIESFNQKKINEEEILQTMRNKELSKLKNKENEISEQQNNIHTEYFEEIEKLMEQKKNLEIEMNTRDKNNSIYLNVLQKKLEDSYKINNDLQMKLLLYKNMIDNEKDNLLIDIESEKINEDKNEKINEKEKEKENDAISNKMIKSYTKKTSKTNQSSEKKFQINLTDISNNNFLNSINKNNILSNNNKRNHSKLKKIIKTRKASEYSSKTLKIDDYYSSNTSTSKNLRKTKKILETSTKGKKISKLTNIKLSNPNLNFVNEKIISYKRQKSDKKLNEKIINTRYSNFFDNINNIKDKSKKFKRQTSKINLKNKNNMSNTTILNNKLKNNNYKKNVKNSFKLKKSGSKKNIIRNNFKNSLTKSISNISTKNNFTINVITKSQNLLENKNDNDNDNDDTDDNYDLVFPSKYHSSLNKNLKIINITIPEDGKTITEFEDHKKIILFEKIGLKKEIYPDGYQINYFKNNDIKQIYPDGKEVYFYSQNNSISTKLPNGTKIVKFQNGQIEKYMPDGTKIIKYSDGMKRNVYVDGSEEIFYCDGTIQKKDKNGVVSIKYSDGKVKIINKERKWTDVDK